MKIKILESCAGSTFFYSKGEEVSDNGNAETLARFKDLVKAGHAVELSGDKSERAVKNEAVEKR